MCCPHHVDSTTHPTAPHTKEKRTALQAKPPPCGFGWILQLSCRANSEHKLMHGTGNEISCALSPNVLDGAENSTEAHTKEEGLCSRLIPHPVDLSGYGIQTAGSTTNASLCNSMSQKTQLHAVPIMWTARRILPVHTPFVH